MSGVVECIFGGSWRVTRPERDKFQYKIIIIVIILSDNYRLRLPVASPYVLMQSTRPIGQ
jgi:hypothetical protein